MATRRARRKQPPSIGRTIRYYAIMGVFTVAFLVVLYFGIMWSMGQIVDIAANMMKSPAK